jgi:hypothetical protein
MPPRFGWRFEAAPRSHILQRQQNDTPGIPQLPPLRRFTKRARNHGIFQGVAFHAAPCSTLSEEQI